MGHLLLAGVAKREGARAGGLVLLFLMSPPASFSSLGEWKWGVMAEGAHQP